MLKFRYIQKIDFNIWTLRGAVSRMKKFVQTSVPTTPQLDIYLHVNQNVLSSSNVHTELERSLYDKNLRHAVSRY